MKLEIIPVTLKVAQAFVRQYHRHHGAPGAGRFCIGAIDGEQNLRTVAICGRPVSRHLDDGFTLEVSRVCSDGARNACSLLYGAARRAGKAMGFRRFVTYTLATETGTSLRAAGWRPVGETKGQQWSRERRPRQILLLADKVRWESS